MNLVARPQRNRVNGWPDVTVTYFKRGYTGDLHAYKGYTVLALKLALVWLDCC
jgi:hypothetical protein